MTDRPIDRSDASMEPARIHLERESEPDVNELVERARRGDRAAFERLYRDHAGRVHAVCLRMTGDPGRAEDLTQDAFIRAWRRLESFRGESAFSTWLHRLAVNVVLEDRRSAGRRETRERSAAPAEAARPARVGLGIDLERAIAELPEGARRVFVLYAIEGYGHREIADMAGIAEGTSKAHLHRARDLLKRSLRR
ncbi:MAG TPA: sigma-70 family RNA polymerase sigma factor [Gemmatimonadota bacterium]|nr:sigma-70 family RNA polymerase sigma factor [Gemmatimonadota bacterium]